MALPAGVSKDSIRAVYETLIGGGTPSNPLSVSASSATIATTTATIANGASLSGAIDLSAGRLARIAIPASWTTANLTFQTSADNVTFNDLYDSYGTEYTATVGGASRAIIIPLADFIGVRYLKIRSGTTGTPVNQGADRTLTLVLVP